MHRKIPHSRRSEQGQTILLVAVALLALLSMAALAIDVVTLYVARSEAQRAANAAAVAGAKIFATSGVTSVQGGGPPPVSLADACTAATAQAQAVALQNTVAGQAAVATAACNTGLAGNPQITVSVARTGLPTFFAKIWNRASNSVSANATAEAYNSSGNEAPIQVSVKPWFIPNCDVNNPGAPHNPNCAYSPFVYTNTGSNDGSIADNGSAIGKTIIVTKVPRGMNPALTAGNLQYFPLDIPVNPAPVCPSTGAVSCGSPASNYLDNIQCSSQYQLSCGEVVGPGDPVTVANNNNNNLRIPAREGTQCLIHGGTTGAIDGQDAINWVANGKPITFTGGDNNPNPALQGVANISRSDSVVTVPLYDGVVAANPLNMCNGFTCNRHATVVGFLQLAIIQTNPLPAATEGSFQARIVNVAGCNPTPTGNTVSGGGVSPVPVRLITAP